ncbi:Hsp20/alpha crystallin family protein [Neobacillus sp. LXY-4]|uniref:Hsp20/alpha crystallin family protein n=1 Tax=Neobacillus sp. LXY-4 TaxID=3379826 RepID=UPI003EE3C02E
MSSNVPFDPKDQEPFGNILKQMNQFFHERPVKGILQTIDDFFRSPFPHMSFPIHVSETNQHHIIKAELPGVKKEQIQLDVLANTLTITVKHHEEITEQDEKKGLYSKKQSLSSASRTVPLPFQINEKAVKATYKNGLLEILIPKQKGKKIIIDHE